MPASEATPEPCPECGGRGWVISADGGAGLARPCDCRRRDLASRLLSACDIPLRYRRCSLDGFQVSNPDRAAKERLLRARSLCQRYVEGFLSSGESADEPVSPAPSAAIDAMVRGVLSHSEAGLIFTGPPGVGKTHLAVAVLRELILRYRVRGRFADFTGLIHQIQATFNPGSPDSMRGILDPVIGAEVLVLDELGAQKPTPWVNDVLYLIINTRYTRRLATLFTTNFRLEAPKRPKGTRESLDRGADDGPKGPELLESRISPLLVSRLFEMAQEVALDGPGDYRREIGRYARQTQPL